MSKLIINLKEKLVEVVKPSFSNVTIKEYSLVGDRLVVLFDFDVDSCDGRPLIFVWVNNYEYSLYYSEDNLLLYYNDPDVEIEYGKDYEAYL